MKNPYHALKAVPALLLAAFLPVSTPAGSMDEYRPPETPEETLALARRTYDYVAKSVPEERLSVLKKELDADAKWLAATKDEKWRRVVEKDIRRIRRRILFMHPDLQFDNLLAVQRGIRYVTELCMVDQYLGRWSRPGPGLVVLENWKKAPRKRVLLEGRLPRGAILNPNLHWDADRVIFAFADHTRPPEADPDEVKVPIVENMLGRHPNSEWVLSQDPGNPSFTEIDGVSQERKAAHIRYFIYEAATDGSWVRQLTGGPGDDMKTTDGRQTVLVEDIDPCYLPDGGFAFISTRNQNFGRCHWGRYTPSFLLYRADEGGRNIRPLSFGEANEWRPAVMNDGRIAYTRWDYINRHAVKYQSLWATRPDGTGVSHVYGNYSEYMYTTTEAAAIPGSQLILATASAHHNYTCGSLVLIDPRVGEDGQEPVTRITPEIPFPESCKDKRSGRGAWDVPGVFANPTPVNDTLFFASYSDEPLDFPKNHPRARPNYGGAWPSQAAYGVWLVDRLGGRELIYKEDEWSTFNPIPLAKRPRPPVLRSVLPPQDSAPTTGVCYVENVYDSRAGIPRGTVKSLRLNRLIDFYACRRPTFVQNLDLALYKECLGEVPVDENGSAMFNIPAGVPIQLQAVDADGKAILTMRSFIYSHRGEIQGCIGCHEQKSMSAPSVRAPGIRKPDDPVKRVDLGYSGAFSFFRSIQPILERRCVTCHNGGERQGKTVCDFTGTNGWNRLVRGGHVKFVKSYSETTESKPYDYFAAASPLMKRLDRGHGGVKLTPDERNTFVLWMDLNVPDCWLGGGYSWHTPEARKYAPSRKPLPPDGHDVLGTCGLDDDCECNSCWVRRGGYNAAPRAGATRRDK